LTTVSAAIFRNTNYIYLFIGYQMYVWLECF
jgi:hypothetical protein